MRTKMSKQELKREFSQTYKEAENSILDILQNAEKPMTFVDIFRQSEIDSMFISDALNDLVEAGKVIREKYGTTNFVNSVMIRNLYEYRIAQDDKH